MFRRMGPSASELRTIPLFHGFADEELAGIADLFKHVDAEKTPLFDVNEPASSLYLLTKGEDNILDAGLRNGIELPYSCKGGVCSTCRCRLLEGEVDMDVNFALEDYEVARGFVLACQSYPVTDKVVVDFDQTGTG